MASQEEKRVIARLRRRAAKMGYRIVSSRWRRDTIDNYGGFQVVDAFRNLVVYGARYDLSIEAVADHLDHLNDQRRQVA